MLGLQPRVAWGRGQRRVFAARARAPIHVRAEPPSESRSSIVSFESRYGMCGRAVLRE